MTAFERLTRNEQVLLLGFLPLLGATSQLGAALIAAVVIAVAAVVVRVAAGLIAGRLTQNAEWAIYAALGYGSAYAVTTLMVYVVPVSPEFILYLHLSGLTPLIFSGVSNTRTNRDLTALLLHCGGLALAFGLLRESLGSGALFGMPLWPAGTIPFGLLESHTGALILFAAAAFPNALYARFLHRAVEVRP